MNNEQLAGLAVGLLGCCLVVFRHWAAHKAVNIYAKLGVTVNESFYAKQFRWVGVTLAIAGLLVALGLV